MLNFERAAHLRRNVTRWRGSDWPKVPALAPTLPDGVPSSGRDQLASYGASVAVSDIVFSVFGNSRNEQAQRRTTPNQARPTRPTVNDRRACGSGDIRLGSQEINSVAFAPGPTCAEPSSGRDRPLDTREWACLPYGAARRPIDKLIPSRHVQLLPNKAQPLDEALPYSPLAPKKVSLPDQLWADGMVSIEQQRPPSCSVSSTANFLCFASQNEHSARAADEWPAGG